MAQVLVEVLVRAGAVMARWRSLASATVFGALCAVTLTAIAVCVAAVYGVVGETALTAALGLMAFVQLSILIGNRRRMPAGAASGLVHEPEEETAGAEMEEPDRHDSSPASPRATSDDSASGISSESARTSSRAAGTTATGIDLLDNGTLDLQFEPVVELTETRTVYYRSDLALTRQDGSRVGPYLLSLTAARGGFAPTLDLALFRRVCPVIRHLKARSRRPGVFCPLSPQSFAQRNVLDELVDFLRANHDAAGGMVIEISQSDLAGLSSEGMEGLAYLAELGATLSLSEARLEGPDPATLVMLGFRFFDLDIAALASAHGWDAFDEHGEVCRLARRAEEAGLTVVAANVVRAEELERVRPFARLARGSLFSPPRVVRRDIADLPAQAAAA